MIKIASGDFNISSLLKALTKGNPFGTRIYSLYNCYDYNLPFVDFWIQEKDNICVSAIGRMGTQFIVQLSDLSDLEEISSFLRVAGATTVLSDNKYKLELFTDKTATGAVLKFFGNPYEIKEEYKLYTPTIKEAYDLLVLCKEEGFEAPDFDSFNLDISHKLRHKAIRMIGYKQNGELKSVAMTVAETETDAVLGAIASHPDYRNKGYGSLMVKVLTNELLRENKNVYLHRSIDKNISFYSNLGYKVQGKWCEFYF